MSKLFGRIDIELLARKFVDLRFQLVEEFDVVFVVVVVRARLQLAVLDAHARTEEVVVVRLHAELVFVLRVKALALLVLRAATVVALFGAVAHGPQSLVLRQSLVFLLHAANLVEVDATLHQLHDDLLLRGAFLVLLDDVFEHLVVGHRRLCRSANGDEHGYQK